MRGMPLSDHGETWDGLAVAPTRNGSESAQAGSLDFAEKPLAHLAYTELP